MKDRGWKGVGTPFIDKFEGWRIGEDERGDASGWTRRIARIAKKRRSVHVGRGVERAVGKKEGWTKFEVDEGTRELERRRKRKRGEGERACRAQSEGEWNENGGRRR